MLKVLGANKNVNGNIMSFSVTDGSKPGAITFKDLCDRAGQMAFTNATLGITHRIGARSRGDIYSLYPCCVVSLEDNTLIVKFNSEFPNELAYLCNVMSSESLYALELIRKNCKDWDYVTVKRGVLNRGEKRFVVTAYGGRTFEPSTEMKKFLHNFLVFECGVFYQYKGVVWFVDRHRGYVRNLRCLGVHDKRKPNVTTMLIFNESWEQGDDEDTSKVYAVELSKEDFISGRVDTLVDRIACMNVRPDFYLSEAGVGHNLGRVLRHKYTAKDVPYIDACFLYGYINAFETLVLQRC